jgi:hypothetical protein
MIQNGGSMSDGWIDLLLCLFLKLFIGGEGGIRTPDTGFASITA